MIGFTMTPSHIDYSKIIDDKTVENIIMGECIIIHGFAVEKAPIKFGQLKNSIMWKTSKAKGGLNSRGGEGHEGEISSPPETTGYIGSNLEYAGPVEFGRADMPAYPRQPYLRPAVDETKKDREERRKRVIDTAIKQAYHG